MSLLLDHIVIRVHDLAQTIEDFTALGFTVQQGGTHADGVTHNALIGFADGSYIELIAFLQAAPQRRWWDVGQRHGDGFVDYALLPSSVGAVIDADCDTTVRRRAGVYVRTARDSSGRPAGRRPAICHSCAGISRRVICVWLKARCVNTRTACEGCRV
jgi:catechol 2,3-dioxygenase-like lactoylglutathione lyase family enzyme